MKKMKILSTAATWCSLMAMLSLNTTQVTVSEQGGVVSEPE